MVIISLLRSHCGEWTVAPFSSAKSPEICMQFTSQNNNGKPVHQGAFHVKCVFEMHQLS